MDFEKRVSVLRSGIEESVHYGAAAVVDSQGKLIHHIGNPDLVTFPRSALKFIQALALVETGAAQAFNLTHRHLALACASHMGEPIHIELVNKWLAQIDVTEQDLACGPDYPLGKSACQEALRAQFPPSRRFHNCSGKHTGFLTVCRHLDYPIKNYHLLEHPVQQLFVQNLGHLIEANAAELNWGVDGCGFPAPAMPLRTMAYAMARFSHAEQLENSKAQAAQVLHQAIAEHPEYMSGTDDLAKHVIRASQGKILVKIGAEGYFIAVVPTQKLGIALKIADGSVRGVELLLLSLLDELDLLDQTARHALDSNLQPAILNSRDEIVGKMTKA